VLGELRREPALRTPCRHNQSEDDKGQGIEGKDKRDALQCDEQAGERRPNHPGKIEADGAEFRRGRLIVGRGKIKRQRLIRRVRED
jgi:hypothetical protein